jgi:hypothetical protein
VANHRDSRVLVVPLGKSTSEIGAHGHHEIPYKLGVYWYGLKGGQKLPPNYVGFRFDGRLQSIHHVETSKTFPVLGGISTGKDSLGPRRAAHPRACDLSREGRALRQVV